MSHFDHIRTKLTSTATLIAALEAMGCQVTQQGSVRGWAGRTTQADVVAHLPSGGDVGFVKQPGQSEFAMVADWMMTGTTQDAFAQRVAQEYAIAAAISQAKAKGYGNFTRTAAEDGTVYVECSRAY